MPHVTAPFECPTPPPPKFPRNPVDGQIVCDAEGNLWEYRQHKDSWLFLGTLDAPPLVTEDNDGMVPPTIFNRISNLKTLTNNGQSIPEQLKLKPHTDAYWYLFDSSDRLIKFTPEGPSKLRIEVDRARLFSLFLGRSCRGPKGEKGDKGDKGTDALPGDPEPCFEPTSISEDGLEMKFNLTVPAPISTEISLRLADSPTATPFVTILIPPEDPGSATIEHDPSVPMDVTRTLDSIDYDIQSQALTGSFFRSAGAWDPNTCILARQKGPVGDKGDDGPCALVANPCETSDENLRYTKPIISMRRGCNANQILALTANLFEKICVDQLRLDVAAPGFDQLAQGSILNGRLMALHKTLEPCKDIAVFTPDPKTLPKPELELPEWRPQPNCPVAKRDEITDLNWIPRTDVAPDESKWDYVDGTRRPKYPWIIMLPEKSDEDGDCDPCDPVPQPPPCPDSGPFPQWYCMRAPDSFDNECINATPALYDQLIAAGYLEVSGPHTDLESCMAVCTGLL